MMDQEEAKRARIRARADAFMRGAGVQSISDAALDAAMEQRKKALPVLVSDVEKHLPLGLSFSTATPAQRVKAAIAAKDAARGRPLTGVEMVVNLAVALEEQPETQP